MQCSNCNENIHSEAEVCPHCGHKVAVTVLSQQERDNFNGVTIEEPSSRSGHGQYRGHEAGGSPRIKQFSFSFGSMGLLGNLVVAAILAAMLFFFLPLVIFVVLIVGAAVTCIWLLRRLLK